MFNETKIVEGEETFVTINRNGEDWRGGLCNTAIVYDNLTQRQIKGWLHGHLNLDSGVINKEEVKLGWELSPPRVNIAIKKGDRVRYKRNNVFFHGTIIGMGEKDLCFIETEGLTYSVKKSFVLLVMNNHVAK